VEQRVAEWLGAEDALLFPSGYQANLGLVTTLAGRGDAVLADALVHASLVDAARLSRARVRVFGHNDLAALDALLIESRGARRRLVLTESIFSMDGDAAPLNEMSQLCARHGAWLVVDEAHAVGLLGDEEQPGSGAWRSVLGRGANESVLAARVVTGGKALGVAGGLVVGSAHLRAEMIGRARAFLFTTGTSPLVTGALCAAVPIARQAAEARTRALAHARRLAQALGIEEPAAAIVPVIVGANEDALLRAQRLARAGLDVRAVRPPTVPVGTARLRIACHATNSEAEVERLIGELRGFDSHPAPRSTVLRTTLARPLVVVGTDTGVGKTIVSALLVQAASRLGSTAYWKPVQTGDDCDTSEVRRLTEGSAAVFHEPAHRFPLAASPHHAAAAAGEVVDVEGLDAELERLTRATGSTSRDGRNTLIVELAGGLLVPLTDTLTQADWLSERRPDIVLVARSGLGTLNHTLLTLEALGARGLEVRALFLVGEPHPSNLRTLEERCGVRHGIERAGRRSVRHIYELPPLRPLTAGAVAELASGLDLGGLLEV
jgi:8-amino-7-oxononanoate synthase